MRIIVLFIPIFLWSLIASSAQVVIDTARINVGSSANIVWRLAEHSGETIDLSGRLNIANPTVFYPEKFSVPAPDSLLASALTRLTDSTYWFSLRICRAALPVSSDTLCILSGIALAGSDSVCTLKLDSLALNKAILPTTLGTIFVHSSGAELPYIRFARLEQNYPNPVRRGQKTAWHCTIDKASELTLTFYDLCGRETFTLNAGFQEKGIHIVECTPPPDLALGVYWVLLSTNSGQSVQAMVISP